MVPHQAAQDVEIAQARALFGRVRELGRQEEDLGHYSSTSQSDSVASANLIRALFIDAQRGLGRLTP